MQLRPSATLLSRPTFGGLWSQNCLKDGHVLRVRIIEEHKYEFLLMLRYILQEVMHNL